MPPGWLPGQNRCVRSRSPRNHTLSTDSDGAEGATLPAKPKDRRTPLLVALIVLLGLALRLWGLGWSLPDARHPAATYHPDERIDLSAAQQADIPHLKFDIGFYNYGTLYFYGVSLA